MEHKTNETRLVSCGAFVEKTLLYDVFTKSYCAVLYWDRDCFQISPFFYFDRGMFWE